mmetsp:Transcript_11256/g.23560  ORF Transcript_11256/g.23560 Transcript_11256/m.23560 type:complete len:202 (-) Transcript_11256:1072-1677(-)
MPSLMVCNQLILLCSNCGSTSLLLQTNHDPVNCPINLLPSNSRFASPCCRNGSLIHQVLQLSTTEARRPPCNGLKINIWFKWLAPCMHSKDSLSALEIRQINSNLPVKPSWPQQCIVQNVHPVSSCNGDNTWIAIKTIHLNQDLVDGLLPLIIPSSKACATLTPNCINLINENDARCILLRLGENIPHTGSSHTNKHLHKL